MLRVLAGSVLSLLTVLAGRPALAEPVSVRFSEGITRGFPVLRSLSGDILAQGELIQVARGDLVESRLVFHFRDGSLYDERVVFSQRDVFTLQSYAIVQRGPSFPETIDARVDRATSATRCSTAPTRTARRRTDRRLHAAERCLQRPAVDPHEEHAQPGRRRCRSWPSRRSRGW